MSDKPGRARSRPSKAGVAPALYSSSPGPMRATHSGNSSGVHSANSTSPRVMLSQARPQRWRGPWCTASSSDSVLSPSSAMSVSVPGVTTRITLRSTGPLPPTSPTCSQMATDSPSLISRAR